MCPYFDIVQMYVACVSLVAMSHNVSQDYSISPGIGHIYVLFVHNVEASAKNAEEPWLVVRDMI
jgi:hypothetical protein